MTVLEDPKTFFGAATLQDPYPLYERMQADAPVHRVGQSDFYAVCGWDAIVEALNRVEDFSSNLTAAMVYHENGTVTPFEMGPVGSEVHALATADDPVHAVHRKILLPHLSARRISVIEEFAEQTAQRLWSDSVADGRVGGLDGRLGSPLRQRRVGGGAGADHHDHVVQRRWRVHCLATWECGVDPGQPTRSSATGS
jgi:cytochrome P450